MNNKTLSLGLMTSQELADWFGVKRRTYEDHSKKYLEKLKDFCDYTIPKKGYIEVKEIYIPIYDKKINKKFEDIYLKEIKYCEKNHHGLSSCAGMARKYGAYPKGGRPSEPTSGSPLRPYSINQARYQLSKAGTRLYDKTATSKQTFTLENKGVVGYRQYIWAIKLSDWNEYRELTFEEDKLFNKIIKETYSGLTTEQVKEMAFLDKSLREKEITVSEYFKQKEEKGLNPWVTCLKRFKDETGLIIARATKHYDGKNVWISGVE